MKQNTISKLGASLLVALGLGTAANAAFMSGTITFASDPNVTLNGLTLQDGSGVTTSDISLAAGVKTWGNASVNGATGSFAPIDVGTAPTMSAPWIFNPSTPLAGLWSVTDNGFTFTFNLTSSVVVLQTPNFLSVAGSGMVTGTGYDATPGTWNFSTQEPDIGGKFTWSASSEAVPDGGTTVAMFGFSLLGLYGARRKFGKA
jgi:hypothetical protein